MFDIFTDRARKIMRFAEQEARCLNREFIGSEHVLLGLVMEGSGVAATVLKNLKIDLRKVLLEIEMNITPGPDILVRGKLPLTPDAIRMVGLAITISSDLDMEYVGSEHLLLALLKTKGIAGEVLKNIGVKGEEVLRETKRLLELK